MTIPRSTVALALLLAACASYDPPFAGDHGAARYRTDLQRCQKQASAKATRAANATPQSSIRALFASDAPERQDMVACMQSRGYALRPAPG